jgi:hypothetical protein
MAAENDDLEPEIMSIRVINNNDFTISDRFDGVPYTFEKDGKALSIPIDAAYHIFGWHREVDPAVMKNYVMKRFGWNTPAMLESGRSGLFYDALKFQPIMYRMVPVEVDSSGTPLRKERAPKPNRLMDAVDEREAARAAP